jgi:hypothetical protein
VCVCVCACVCVWVGFVMCGCLDNVHSLNLFGYPDWGFSVLFPQLQGKCQGIIRKDWARPTHFHICYLCCFVCYSCCFVVNLMFYVLFMCKCVLPSGVNAIAVDKCININILVRPWTLPRSTPSTESCAFWGTNFHFTCWMCIYPLSASSSQGLLNIVLACGNPLRVAVDSREVW